MEYKNDEVKKVGDKEIQLLVKRALTPHVATVIVAAAGQLVGREGHSVERTDGHFHACRTALNTRSLGYVSHDGGGGGEHRSSYQRLKHRTD